MVYIEHITVVAKDTAKPKILSVEFVRSSLIKMIIGGGGDPFKPFPSNEFSQCDKRSLSQYV